MFWKKREITWVVYETTTGRILKSDLTLDEAIVERNKPHFDGLDRLVEVSIKESKESR